MDKSYEKSVQRIDEIITVLEAGGLDLSEAIKAFEEGVDLIAECNKMLGDAKSTLEVLREEKE